MDKQKYKSTSDSEHYDKFNTVSTTECTGLITVPPEDEHELENYMDVYDFGPFVSDSNPKRKTQIKKEK